MRIPLFLLINFTQYTLEQLTMNIIATPDQISARDRRSQAVLATPIVAQG
jgi:hypothetical protein